MVTVGSSPGSGSAARRRRRRRPRAERGASLLLAPAGTDDVVADAATPAADAAPPAVDPATPAVDPAPPAVDPATPAAAVDPAPIETDAGVRLISPVIESDDLAPSTPGYPAAPIELPLATPVDRPLPAFAHASEAEMARILDYYRIAWEYEPHTFPILWNLDGVVTESFSPDFWLPELDLYLEMTTLRQKLVRKKNRKLRRVRELYPDLRIKLFYARDFRALLLKFGRLGLAAGLTGSSGQVSPGRLEPEASAAELLTEPGL